MATEWISVTEAVNLSGYHPDHLRELVRAGKIKSKKVVTVWQVSRSSLLDYMRRTQKLGAKRGPKRRD